MYNLDTEKRGEGPRRAFSSTVISNSSSVPSKKADEAFFGGALISLEEISDDQWQPV